MRLVLSCRGFLLGPASAVTRSDDKRQPGQKKDPLGGGVDFSDLQGVFARSHIGGRRLHPGQRKTLPGGGVLLGPASAVTRSDDKPPPPKKTRRLRRGSGFVLTCRGVMCRRSQAQMTSANQVKARPSGGGVVCFWDE